METQPDEPRAASGVENPHCSQHPAGPPSLALDQLPRLGVGIRLKLIGLMVAMAVVVVCPLATYFPARELEVLRAEHRNRAEVYASLASQQLRSAVAFDDRETAREVLGAIARDPLIDGVAVYDEGQPLDVEGQLSAIAQAAGQKLTGSSLAYYLPGRILATAPIRSLEGAQGAVVVELSTRDSKRLQERLMLAALASGGAALLAGAGLAWLIARSLSRRIEVIADAASAMSRGELEHAVDTHGPNDELGLLAHGFNAMSRKLRELVQHIQQSAREESERLERLVVRRTEQLNTKNRDLRLVLDNVEQGFVTIDRRGHVVGEASRAIQTWLGKLDTDTSLWAQLARGRPQATFSFEAAWAQVIENVLPLEASLDQMPHRLELGERHLELEYRPLGGDEFDRLLVVVTDVTAVVAREKSEQESRDLVNLTTRLLRDRDGFLEFFAETRRLVQSVADNKTDAPTRKRDLHTLKGNAALYGLTKVSATCHELETHLELESIATLDPSPLVRDWDRCVLTVERLLGERETGRIEIDEAKYSEVLDAIEREAPKHQVARMLKAWRLEPLRARLQRAAEQLISISGRLGKGKVVVLIRAGDVYVGREELSEFWGAFAHVIRNAAVHGLEPEEARADRPDKTDFDLLAGVEKDRLFVELTDHGPGIDWDSIRARASARGVPHSTDAELEEALFVDGISTRTEACEAAGRGMGLSAVRAACRRQHGQVRVTTRRGVGTTFRFSWPASQFPSLVELERGAL